MITENNNDIHEDQRDIQDPKKQVPSLGDKKILNNIRIYKTNGVGQDEKPVKPFQRYLPQFMANCAINLIMADSGLALSYPALVIGHLLPSNLTAIHQTDQFLNLKMFSSISFDKLQSSIYSSLQFLAIPVGCMVGGSIIDRFGRRKVIIFSSLPMMISWLMNFFSRNVSMLYVANMLSGIAIGLGEAPIATYQGEITEPAIRGVIINFGILWLAVSLLGPYLLHLAVPSWRWIALMCSVVPVVAALVTLLVPESPIWLLSKGQVTMAERELTRLRGGASKKEINEEIQTIISYHYNSSTSCNRLDPQTTSEDSKPSRERLKQKWDYFKSDQIRRPFILSCVMFGLVHTTGIATLRNYINPVLQMIQYRGNWTVIGLTLTLVGVLGNVFGLLIIGFTGKRVLVLYALSMNGLSSLMVAIALFKHWPVDSEIAALHVMFFVTGFGIVPIPWILQSELYPFRGRGMAAGLAAAISYLMAFVAALSFLPLADLMTLQSVFIIFFLFSLFGVVYMYFMLPETEGRTLHQIEQYFSGRS